MPLELLAAASLIVWLYLVFCRGAFWREFSRRPAAAPAVRGPAPSVAVIIPARNEASVVARAIASLAAQRYPGAFHIILVDDHSTDGTADAARAAAPPERLTVVSAAPLPPGWTGKLWAVSEGIRYAARLNPEYLLLTDADIVHPPGNLAALVASARGDKCDLVSYMATLACNTPAERALVPAFVFFFFMLYPPAWIRRAGRSTAGAAGGCMLLRRTALDRIGGIDAIRGNLIDDCALARAVKRGGGRVRLERSSGTRSIRTYGSFAEIGGMISRTAFAQLGYSALTLAATVLGLVLTYLLPPLLTLLAPQPAAGMAATAWLLMSLAYLPVLRFYGRAWWTAPLLPLVSAFYLAATVVSAMQYWRGAGGQWKGRAQAGRTP